MSSDLQEGFSRCGQQVDSGRKFLEELSGQIPQTSTLDPVHQQVQVGPNLNPSGPLVEPGHRPWTMKQTEVRLQYANCKELTS